MTIHNIKHAMRDKAIKEFCSSINKGTGRRDVNTALVSLTEAMQKASTSVVSLTEAMQKANWSDSNEKQ
jgi:hypothetical protein